MNEFKKIFTSDLVESRRLLLEQLEREQEMGWTNVSNTPTDKNQAISQIITILLNEMETFEVQSG